LQGYCKLCASEWHKAYVEEHREEQRAKRHAKYVENAEENRIKAKAAYDANPELSAIASRKWYLKKHYGLTPEEYDAEVAKRNGRCDICGKVAVAKNKWRSPLHVDHNHTTGAVRGYLCPSCNTAIGSLGDTSAGILKAYEYVKSAEL